MNPAESAWPNSNWQRPQRATFTVSDLAVDGSGSLFVAGSFSGAIDLAATDPGPGSVTAVGGKDVFLAKYGQDGVLLWADVSGGPPTMRPRGWI